MNLSKKLRKMFTQTLLDSYPLNKSFSEKDRDCFLWLTGLQGDVVMRAKHPRWSNSKNNVEIDGKVVSWVNAIYTRDQRKLVLDVMRDLIKPEVENFKRRTDCVCAICGSRENPTVDHADPTFIQMVKSFLNENDIQIDDVEITKKENVVGHRFQDVDLESRWLSYHANNAVLQILCRSCNSKKGDTGWVRSGTALDVKMKGNHWVQHCDAVRSVSAAETISKAGNQVLRIEWVTDRLEFITYHTPAHGGKWQNLFRRFSFNEVLQLFGTRTPKTVTYHKNETSGFFEVLAFNEEADEAPQDGAAV